jgi:hypothetical protein
VTSGKEIIRSLKSITRVHLILKLNFQYPPEKSFLEKPLHGSNTYHDKSLEVWSFLQLKRSVRVEYMASPAATSSPSP